MILNVPLLFRWFTYLNSDFKKGGWSPEEDMLLCEVNYLCLFPTPSTLPRFIFVRSCFKYYSRQKSDPWNVPVKLYLQLLILMGCWVTSAFFIGWHYKSFKKVDERVFIYFNNVRIDMTLKYQTDIELDLIIKVTCRRKRYLEIDGLRLQRWFQAGNYMKIEIFPCLNLLGVFFGVEN